MPSVADNVAGSNILWRTRYEKGPVELGQRSGGG